MDAPVQSQTATAVIPPALSQPVPPASSSTPDEGRFVPGTLVAGRYRIISLLGRGGMGEVYRATDLTLAQPVALKFLPDSGPDHQRALERFHNEVRIARQVSHPNVCRVYDVGEADGMPYISMEYVDGEDLASLLQRIGRLPADKALEIARKICAGVAAAHDKGVIHRDLKPANIMLDQRGNVVVMDFGLAAVADQLRGAEARSGTPAYMAPEQLRGEQVTAKSDIYALGMVLYEIFTGKRAYEAATMAELIRMQESAQITSMSSIAAEIDPAVEKAIRRCLDPDPAKRPASALMVAAALPGGDPLAAALAAGETPSPELVAASGKTEGLPLKKSVPLALGHRRPHYRRAVRAQQRRAAQLRAVRAFAGCARRQDSRARRRIRLYRGARRQEVRLALGLGRRRRCRQTRQDRRRVPPLVPSGAARCASAIARVRCRWSRCRMARSPSIAPRRRHLWA